MKSECDNITQMSGQETQGHLVGTRSRPQAHTAQTPVYHVTDDALTQPHRSAQLTEGHLLK